MNAVPILFTTLSRLLDFSLDARIVQGTIQPAIGCYCPLD